MGLPCFFNKHITVFTALSAILFDFACLGLKGSCVKSHSFANLLNWYELNCGPIDTDDNNFRNAET